MDDPRHWAFALCEDLRRKIEESSESLVRLFCSGLRDARQLEGAKTTELNVPWSDFLGVLDKLKVRMRPQEESELQDLLNARGGRGGGTVNLAILQSLLGLPEDLGPLYSADYKRFMAYPADKRDKNLRVTVEMLM
jgi:hypothetical protein